MFSKHTIIVTVLLWVLSVNARYLHEDTRFEDSKYPIRVRRQSPNGDFSYNKDFLTPEGHGVSAGLSGSSSGVFQGNLQGQVGLLNTPDHRLQAFAGHQKTFGSDLRQVAPDVNSLGLNYQHSSGAKAFVSGSHSVGTPFNTVTGGGSIPLSKDGNTNLGASYSNTFGGGIKPQHSFGLQLEHRF